MTQKLEISADSLSWLKTVADDWDIERWTADVQEPSAPWNSEEFSSLAALKAAVTASGSPFFSKDTMRFFGSKLHGDIRGRRFFISSEHNFDRTARLFTVRWFHKYPDAVQLSGSSLQFQQFETIEEARKAVTILQGITAEVIRSNSAHK